MITNLATDWPTVETDMVAWRQWAKAAPPQEHTMTADNSQSAGQDIYASQLLEALSDVVDILNEAKADGHIFNFQISSAPDGKFVLTSLTCTKQIVTAP